MVPESVADYLLQRYNILSTFEMMQDELTDYLERTEQMKRKSKKINVVWTSEENGVGSMIKSGTHGFAWQCQQQSGKGRTMMMTAVVQERQ